MKILTIDKVREADAFTIQQEPIASIDLMERAASACFSWLISHLPRKGQVLVFCGNGNNGGDGFAIARMLKIKGFSVTVFMAGNVRQLSADCQINADLWLQLPESIITNLPENEILPAIQNTDIVIDAMLGSGLTRPVEGFLARLIDHINKQRAMVISIDVPSGLFCDISNRDKHSPIIKADYTLTFSPLKLGFLFPENDPFIGEWQLQDIGLMPEFIEKTETRNFYIDSTVVQGILHKRNKFAHKGNFGHAMLICGSQGKMGAAVLAATACLRSGPGLVTVRVPACGVSILQTAVPEAMLSIDPDEKIFSEVPDLRAYGSIALGPGLGQIRRTANAIKLLIQNTRVPVIFDADAVNILAENKTWLSFLPEGCIFTPHMKEFERLAGKSNNDFERNSMQREFSFRYQAYVILKGAHTAITTPDGLCFFNSTGNPGMATGGSGDVLTGILAGLQAQGYSSLETCLLGVYLHGLAGDYAFASNGNEALIASDIINNLGEAFQSLYGKF